MNFFELLVFLLNIAIGAIAATKAYAVGGFWPIIPAFIAGFLLIPALLVLLTAYAKWAYPDEDKWPDCTCGENKFQYEKVDSEYHCLCIACRQRYARRRRKLYVYDGGIEKLYAELVRRKGWVRSAAGSSAEVK